MSTTGTRSDGTSAFVFLKPLRIRGSMHDEV
jgi:hypothetical protein